VQTVLTWLWHHQNLLLLVGQQGLLAAAAASCIPFLLPSGAQYDYHTTMPASKASAVQQLKTALAESSRLLHHQDTMIGIIIFS